MFQDSTVLAATPPAVTFDKAHARSPLGLLTLAYLALPNLIFFVGWLKPALALLPLLSIALAFRFEFSKSNISRSGPSAPIHAVSVP